MQDTFYTSPPIKTKSINQQITRDMRRLHHCRSIELSVEKQRQLKTARCMSKSKNDLKNLRSTDMMSGLIVHCDRHWNDNQFMGSISFACFLTNKEKDAYSELSEKIFHRIGVKNDRFEIRISSQLQTKNGKCTLSIMTDIDVTCLLTYNPSDWHEINVEVVEKSVQAKIHSACTPLALKPTSNSQSPVGTPYLKSVSGSNQPFGSVPSLGITSTKKDHGTPTSTNKHSEVDDSDSFETSDTEDECSSDSYTSNDLNGVSEVPQCGGQVERFELKVRRSNHTRKQSGRPKKQSGRPQKPRTPFAGEKRKQQTCLNCGQKGHNKKGCQKPSSTASKPARKARTCSVCKKEGHNRLKCPDKPP
ncbi:hypothetical protein LWI29_018125 [Acer saccharum]|uniref:CCHC-type domain-containing protein n=1 Tax=Acer saccharum TaxID=4024 RepID=A0AA39RXA4_ACESA|nr:hypothetical protein LWI29_018125 [Acer saccharum]